MIKSTIKIFISLFFDTLNILIFFCYKSPKPCYTSPNIPMYYNVTRKGIEMRLKRNLEQKSRSFEGNLSNWAAASDRTAL